MPATALIYWGGVDITAGWSFTFSPGIYPSQCIIDSPPHSASLADYGDLVIAYGDNGDGGGRTTQLVFTDCILERPTLRSSGVKMWQLPIQDRRWKWRGGHITGEYNKQKPDGTYIREQEPQQLATKLLQAMGESAYGFDVSRLPNDSRPYRKWDYSNPAAELQSLCDELGCIVVLNPLINKVELWPIGEGPELPGGVTIGGAVPFEKIQEPSSIHVVTQPVLFESEFYVNHPVGIDTDGKVKSIHSLSYAPADWSEVSSMDSIQGTYVDENGVERKLAELAESCIWKMYEIGNEVSGSLNSGFGDDSWFPKVPFETMRRPSSIDEIQFLPFRLTEYTLNDGTKKKSPPKLSGYRFIGTEFGPGTAQENVEGWSIDQQRKLIVFSQPAFFYNNDYSGINAFRGTLKIAFTVINDGIPYRWTPRFELGGKGMPEVVSAGGISRSVIYQYRTPFFATEILDSIDDNANTLTPEIEKIKDRALAKYRQQPGQNTNYPGINPISPNGKIRQVTWSKQASGAIITTASMAREHNPFSKTAKENQRRAEQERQRDGMLRLDEGTRAIENLRAFQTTA